MNSQRIEHFDLFQFEAPSPNPMQREGWCDLQVFRRADNGIVVVATDPIKVNGDYAYDGLSVCNGVEFIATKVVTEIGFVFDHFIEHYPARGYNLDRALARGHRPQFEENFAVVTFEWDLPHNRLRRPHWKHISRALAEKIIGVPFHTEYVK